MLFLPNLKPMDEFTENSMDEGSLILEAIRSSASSLGSSRKSFQSTHSSRPSRSSKHSRPSLSALRSPKLPSWVPPLPKRSTQAHANIEALNRMCALFPYERREVLEQFLGQSEGDELAAVQRYLASQS